METYNPPIENISENQEKKQLFKEKVKMTNVILKKLIFWGVLAFSPFSIEQPAGEKGGSKEDVAMQLKELKELEESFESKEVFEIPDSKENTEDMVKKFEENFENSGLLEHMPGKREKSVIVIISKNELGGIEEPGENMFSGALLAEKMKFDFVRGKTAKVVERSKPALSAILSEFKLEESGLTNPQERHKLGNFLKADYYTVVSSEMKEGKLIFKSEIIGVKNGSKEIVYVKSDKNQEELSVEEMETLSTELYTKSNTIIEQYAND